MKKQRGKKGSAPVKKPKEKQRNAKDVLPLFSQGKELPLKLSLKEDTLSKISARVKHLFYPPLPLWGLWVCAGFVFVALTLSGVLTHPIFIYASYLASSYALVILCLRIPGLCRFLKGEWIRFCTESPRLAPLWDKISNPAKRMRLLLIPSLLTNLAFAVFKLLVGYHIHSPWVTAIGAYYGILSCLRFYLLSRPFPADASPEDWKNYRVSAYFLLLLTLPMACILTQVAIYGKSYDYPGLLIFAFALYAFVKMISTTANLIRHRKGENRTLSASRCISFACGLMAILGLQTALNARYDTDGSFSRLSNILYGAFVILAMLSLCIFMLYRAYRAEHSEENKSPQN